MGGCSAEFCNNSSLKGYVMRIFPRNPERRALWMKNVGRKNWTPTNNTYLCEVHFAPNMWEQRADSKRKLKPNAVPTIFGFFLKKNTAINNNVKDNILNNDVSENQLNNKNQDMEHETITNIPESSSLAKNNVSDNVLTNVSDNQLNNKNQDMEYETIIKKQHLRMINMRRKMKALRKTIGTLQTKLSNKYKAALNSIFTDDQIQALFTKKRSIRNWSHKTIYRALQLKLACGNIGYEQLIQQGYPLPSLRTLRRRLEDFKFERGISKEI